MVRVILVRHGRTTANSTGVLAGRTAAELDDHGRAQAEALADLFAAIPLAAAVSSPLLRTQQTAELLLSRRDPPVNLDLDEGFTEVDYGEWTGAALKDLAGDPLWRVVQSHPSAVTFPQGESMAAMSARAVGAVRRWVAQVAPPPQAEPNPETSPQAEPAPDPQPAHAGAPPPQPEPQPQVDSEAAAAPPAAASPAAAPPAAAPPAAAPPTAASPAAAPPAAPVAASPAASAATVPTTPPAPPPPPPNLLVVSHGDVIKAILADALGLHLDAFQRICVDPASVSVVLYGPHRPMVECINTDGSLLRTWNLETPAATASVPGGGAGR